MAYALGSRSSHHSGSQCPRRWQGLGRGIRRLRRCLLPGLSKLASTIKTNGTKAILQIFHAGRMTDDSVLRGTQPISASAVAAERPNAQVPREVTVDEILTIIENFKKLPNGRSRRGLMA